MIHHTPTVVFAGLKLDHGVTSAIQHHQPGAVLVVSLVVPAAQAVTQAVLTASTPEVHQDQLTIEIYLAGCVESQYGGRVGR